MKKTTGLRLIAAALVTLIGGVAMAYISEGNWTDGRDYYYVNNRGQYCTSRPTQNARQLDYYQVRELRSLSYQGQCESYDKGPKNYRGTSYYFNGEGAYCRYAYYRQAAELSSWEADRLFRSNRFDGTCRE